MDTWFTAKNAHEVCEHGSMRRKCITCESLWQDKRIAELEHELSIAKLFHDVAVKEGDYERQENEWLRGLMKISKKLDLPSYEAGKHDGMERAAEIAWELHCSGPPNSIHTAYDASNAIRAEIDNAGK